MAKQRIVWRDPPIDNRHANAGEFLEFALALRTRPGQWAVMPTNGRTEDQCLRLIANIKRGSNASFRPVANYEFRRSHSTIYARYIGAE